MTDRDNGAARLDVVPDDPVTPARPARAGRRLPAGVTPPGGFSVDDILDMEREERGSAGVHPVRVAPCPQHVELDRRTALALDAAERTIAAVDGLRREVAALRETIVEQDAQRREDSAAGRARETGEREVRRQHGELWDAHVRRGGLVGGVRSWIVVLVALCALVAAVAGGLAWLRAPAPAASPPPPQVIYVPAPATAPVSSPPAAGGTP